MTAAVILQARMTSTRLPGKVMKRVGGRTILEWMIRASSQVPGISVVCAAVPVGSEHDTVAAEAERLGAPVVRGPEFDVLERFRLAAEVIGASEVMRVTTDCPMMDPALCGEVLALRRASGADYACNNEPYSYPHGLDCEVFTTAVLEKAAAAAKDDYDREHVTPWIKRHPSLVRSYLVGPGGECAHWRWTIDHYDDLHFFEQMADALGDRANDWIAVSDYICRNPHLLDINRAHRQR